MSIQFNPINFIINPMTISLCYLTSYDSVCKNIMDSFQRWSTYQKNTWQHANTSKTTRGYVKPDSMNFSQAFPRHSCQEYFLPIDFKQEAVIPQTLSRQVCPLLPIFTLEVYRNGLCGPVSRASDDNNYWFVLSGLSGTLSYHLFCLFGVFF